MHIYIFKKLPTYGQMQPQWWKQSESEKRKSQKRRERDSRKKIKVREKEEKSRNTVSLLMICVSGGLAIWSDEKSKITRDWREVKIHKTPKVRSAFGRWGVEKVHVARSTFPSQNVQNIPLSEHFWKLRC